MRVKQLIGIALAAATILNAVPVTSLTQPEVVKAEVLTTCGTAKLGSSKTTINKIPDKNLRMPLKVELQGLNRGDKIKSIDWQVVDTSIHRTIYFHTTKVNKTIRNSSYRASNSNCIIEKTGKYKARCTIYLEAHVIGDYKIVSNEYNFNVVTDVSYLTKEVGRTWKETNKLFDMNFSSIKDTDRYSVIKQSNVTGAIQGTLANYNLIRSRVKELDPNATISVTCSAGKPSFYIKNKKARKVYKSAWKNSLDSIPIDDGLFTILIKNNGYKEYFKANKGKGAYIKIPVKVKVSIKSGTKTKSLNNSAYIIIEE